MKMLIDTPSQQLSFFKTGEGPAVFLLHGWPFHTATYRKLLPLLEPHFTCYNILSTSMDGRAPDADVDMSFAGHADRVVALAHSLNLEKFSIIGHNTGGTIARIVATLLPLAVNKLVLLNTEMPYHRPPFIPFFQKLFALPGAKLVLALLMRSRAFLRSPMGFGGCFYDKTHIDDEFIALFAEHWFDEHRRFAGLKAYLCGLNFNDVDSLNAIHSMISAPILFIWGKQDITFPAALGKMMAQGVPSCAGFIEIDDACFLAHEEKPSAVAEHTINFLSAK